MTIIEMRDKRTKLLATMDGFLDTHRDGKGLLSAEDDATYAGMEKELAAITNEIKRMERREAIDAELSKPVSSPITSKPMTAKDGDTKTGRAADEYKSNFWNVMRSKAPMPQVVNALQVGVDSEGGYLVPDEYERTLVEALEEENIFRKLARIINTASGERKIPVVASKGTANWIDEEGPYEERDDTFSQVTIGANKLGTTIKVSEELINDSVFDLEAYIAREFARRIGAREEDSFFNGDGVGKPLGIFAETGGAEIGVTAASATDITADELIDLVYSLKRPYRKNAKFICNDQTLAAIRKLTDKNGRYLWQDSVQAGEPGRLLGYEVYTSPYFPVITAGMPAIAFGDYSYYNIGDRGTRSFAELKELFAGNGMVGFVAKERVDGKLVLPEAVKLLKMATA